MGLIIIQDTIPNITTMFPMNIGYDSLTTRTDELNTTPSRNNSLPSKMCKAHQGPQKERIVSQAPCLLGTMAVSFRECKDDQKDTKAFGCGKILPQPYL